MTTQPLPLTDQDVEFYRTNGYLQLRNLLSPREVADLKATMVAAIAKYEEIHPAQLDTPYGRVLNQKVNLWTIDEAMARWVKDWRFAEIARRLTGARGIRLFHDHALLKMPGDSKPTPWHQDTVYWPMEEEGALSIWIALDDVDETNGCMSFIPQTRDLGKLDPVSLTEPRDIIKEHLKGDASAVKVMEMPAGSVTFHDGLTFHYASANKSPRPRHALAIIYMPDTTTYNGKPHVVTDGKDYLEAGKPLAGPDFPLLAEGEA